MMIKVTKESLTFTFRKETAWGLWVLSATTENEIWVYLQPLRSKSSACDAINSMTSSLLYGTQVDLDWELIWSGDTEYKDEKIREKALEMVNKDLEEKLT